MAKQSTVSIYQKKPKVKGKAKKNINKHNDSKPYKGQG